MGTPADLRIVKKKAWVDVQPPRTPLGSGTLHVVIEVELLEGKESRKIELRKRYPQSINRSILLLDLVVGDIDLGLPNTQEVRYEEELEDAKQLTSIEIFHEGIKLETITDIETVS